MDDSQRDEPRLKAWQGALALVLVGIGAQLLGGFVALIALVIEASVGGASLLEVMNGGELSFAVLAPSLIATGLGMGGGAAIVVAAARVPVKKGLGIRPAPWPAFVVAPIGILALGPTSDFMRRLMVEYLPDLTLGSLDQLDAAVRSAPLWIVAPLFSLVPGIAEELLFRGAFQRSIRTPWLAIGLSAFFFAAYHFDPHHVAAVLPLGFYLAWLGHRTGSVLVPITAHVANNATAVIASVAFPESPESAGLFEDWWWIPTGWAIAALAVAVVWWSTRARWAAPLGPGELDALDREFGDG
jgi:membrane protease YdiL (CAAX protease family)